MDKEPVSYLSQHMTKSTIRLVRPGTCSLIKVFAEWMCFLKPPGYPKWDKQESLPYWVDVHADLSLCWSHRSHCRFCCALAHFCMKAEL